MGRGSSFFIYGVKIGSKTCVFRRPGDLMMDLSLI